MTDGPFKGLKLTATQKKVVEALVNTAYSDNERSDRLSNSCVQYLAKSGDMKLIASLKAQAANDQMDLDPVGTMKRVFSEHEKTGFANRLDKEGNYLTAHGSSCDAVLSEAFPKAVEGHVRDECNRIREELIRVRDSGEAPADDVAGAIRNLERAERDVSVGKICSALLKGNKDAFKESVAKKQDEDEGPIL